MLASDRHRGSPSRTFGLVRRDRIWDLIVSGYEPSAPENDETPDLISVGGRAGLNKDHLVPGAGLEPARPFGRRILNPLRLPIPPPGRRLWSVAAHRAVGREIRHGDRVSTQHPNF